MHHRQDYSEKQWGSFSVGITSRVVDTGEYIFGQSQNPQQKIMAIQIYLISIISPLLFFFLLVWPEHNRLERFYGVTHTCCKVFSTWKPNWPSERVVGRKTLIFSGLLKDSTTKGKSNGDCPHLIKLNSYTDNSFPPGMTWAHNYWYCFITNRGRSNNNHCKRQ